MIQKVGGLEAEFMKSLLWNKEVEYAGKCKIQASLRKDILLFLNQQPQWNNYYVLQILGIGLKDTRAQVHYFSLIVGFFLEVLFMVI